MRPGRYDRRLRRVFGGAPECSRVVRAATKTAVWRGVWCGMFTRAFVVCGAGWVSGTGVTGKNVHSCHLSTDFSTWFIRGARMRRVPRRVGHGCPAKPVHATFAPSHMCRIMSIIAPRHGICDARVRARARPYVRVASGMPTKFVAFCRICTQLHAVCHILPPFATFVTTARSVPRGRKWPQVRSSGPKCVGTKAALSALHERNSQTPEGERSRDFASQASNCREGNPRAARHRAPRRMA